MIQLKIAVHKCATGHIPVLKRLSDAHFTHWMPVDEFDDDGLVSQPEDG